MIQNVLYPLSLPLDDLFHLRLDIEWGKCLANHFARHLDIILLLWCARRATAAVALRVRSVNKALSALIGGTSSLLLD